MTNHTENHFGRGKGGGYEGDRTDSSFERANSNLCDYVYGGNRDDHRNVLLGNRYRDAGLKVDDSGFSFGYEGMYPRDNAAGGGSPYVCRLENATTDTGRGQKNFEKAPGLFTTEVHARESNIKGCITNFAPGDSGDDDQSDDYGRWDGRYDERERDGRRGRADSVIRDMFDRADLNQKGSLSKGEMSQAAVGELLKLDSNDDGAISLGEAMGGAGKGSAFSIGALGQALADANRDGKVDQAEMQRIGEKLADILLKLGDKNGDGKLGFDEFAGLLGKGGSGCGPRPPETPPAPGDPRQPSEPRDPGGPKDPGGPVNPGDPRGPAEPAEPADPRGPTDPPREPADPREPTDPREPADPSDGSVRKPTDAQIEEAFKQVENRGASEKYMQELKAAMKQMPAEFVESFIKGRTKMVVYGQGPDGLGGTYNSGNNTITMYESAPFSTVGVLACEMAHNWDLNPYVGEHITSQPWFQEAYAKARRSGISQGDNSYTNVYEFIHHMAKYYSGIKGGGVSQLMDYLGEDYRRRTGAALMS